MGAAFESDHQFVAGQNQGMIDFVCSTDTDLPMLGIKQMIYDLGEKGNCKVIDLHERKENYFSKIFDCRTEEIKQFHIRLFACLRGTDYCPKHKLYKDTCNFLHNKL